MSGCTVLSIGRKPAVDDQAAASLDGRQPHDAGAGRDPPPAARSSGFDPTPRYRRGARRRRVRRGEWLSSSLEFRRPGRTESRADGPLEFRSCQRWPSSPRRSFNLPLPVAAPEHQRHASFVVIRNRVTATRDWPGRDRLRRRCYLRDKKRDGDCQWKTHARPCRQRKCFPRGARSNVMDRPPDGGEGRLFVTECGHGPQIGREPPTRDPRTRDLFYGFRYVNEPSRSSAP